MSMNYEYELSVPKQFKTDDKEQVINVMSEPLLRSSVISKFYRSVVLWQRTKEYTNKAPHYVRRTNATVVLVLKYHFFTFLSIN